MRQALSYNRVAMATIIPCAEAAQSTTGPGKNANNDNRKRKATEKKTIAALKCR